MLSLFPSLLSYEQLSPFILRIILGITLMYFGYKKITGTSDHVGSKSKMYGIIELCTSVFLILGLWTQVAALVASIILGSKLALKIRSRAFLTDGINYYLILLIIAISLLFTGAGWFAFDLPL